VEAVDAPVVVVVVGTAVAAAVVVAAINHRKIFELFTAGAVLQNCAR
jgi:hypothetical protein